MELLGVALLFGSLFLIVHRWFWVIVFVFAGLVSLIAMLVSIFHFQILAALGYFVLMAICVGIMQAVIDGDR